MNYELAKKLKDAGFPQGEIFENILSKGVALAYLRESKPSDELLDKYSKALNALKVMYKDDEEHVHVPTLSELIEACDCDKFMLKRIPHKFKNKYYLATDEHMPGDRVGIIGMGSEPEEAVANLWLALNK